MSYPVRQRYFKQIRELVKENSRDFTIGTTLDIAIAKSFLLEDLNPRLKKPSLCSSADGPISALLLSIPKYAVLPTEQNPFWKVFTDLISKLPDYTRFVILIHDSALAEFQSWVRQQGFGEDRFLIKEIPDDVQFSIWAEDPYAIVSDKAEKYIMEPLAFRRPSDAVLADYCSDLAGFPLHDMPLHYEGGNFLVADTFLFIGADYANYTMRYEGSIVHSKKKEEPRELVKRLYREHLDAKRKLIFIGSKQSVPHEQSRELQINGETWKEHLYPGNPEGTVQPMFHIDMFMPCRR